MWKVDALPLIRVTMSCDRSKMMLSFIRFDIQNTREKRQKTDKALPIRDIWTMLKENLQKTASYTNS